MKIQIGCVFLLAFMLQPMIGCQNNNKPPNVKPAKVEAHPSENDIYRIVLTSKAESRLQISTVKATQQQVRRTMVVGGEVVVPDGSRIRVDAPITGTFAMTKKDLRAGSSVAKGESLMIFSPIISPERELPTAAERAMIANSMASVVSARVQAQRDVETATSQLEIAKIAKDRAEKLLADRVGSQRDFDQASADFDIAQKTLDAAKERKAMLDKLKVEAQSGKLPALEIKAPQSGTVQTISAQPGQVVNFGTPLFEIIDQSNLWIRVPVFVGHVSEVNQKQNGMIRVQQSNPYNVIERIVIKPVVAPPTADPLAASIDLFYVVDNKAGRFRPGQRVMIEVPYDGVEESLVVPRSSVIIDIHGTEWVYVKTGEHQFKRVRVAVKFSTKDLAVLSKGPNVGVPVVVDGAAELFGTEFGAGK